jgi:O-antigen/teichoic acid export membrane protein
MQDKNSIGKGVVYLYIESITTLFSGYVYWLILSKMIDPSSIGLASSVIAFATIAYSFASIGVSGGIQRYIANGIAENRFDKVQGTINSSLLITGIGVCGIVVITMIFRDSTSNYFGFSFDYILLSIILSVFLVFFALLRAIIIPSLKVKVITMAAVVSTVIKLSVTIALVLLGYGVFGILVGFLSYSVISTLIFTYAIKKKIYKNLTTTDLFTSTKDILITSVTFWIPLMLNTIGSQLGTISVFLAVGSSNAGIYFISFSIVTGITLITTVLSSVAYPTISALKDGKKRATWRLIKISLILTVPISNILLFYPVEILSLFGPSYTSGSLTLQILSLSLLPTCIFTGIGVLLYSYGNNRSFLLLGLVTSLPRVLLYFPFVSTFGENGAALSFLIGSVSGVILSVIYAKRIKIKLHYKQILVLFMLPIVIAIALKYADLNPVISILAILVSTYFVYVLLKLIDSEDIQDLTKILPKYLVKIIYVLTNTKSRRQNEK